MYDVAARTHTYTQNYNRWEEMLNLIVQHGGQAGRVPQHVLAKRVKGALDAQWQRLRFGKLIDKACFLPLPFPGRCLMFGGGWLVGLVSSAVGRLLAW